MAIRRARPYNQAMKALAALRVISAIEGVSYLLLLFVAMPLKYGLDEPLAVRVLGMAHGWLFVAFVGALAWAMWARGWSVARGALLFGLSLVPFGFLGIDRSLRAERETTSPE